MGGVALPNPASVGLLEKFGLHQVAHFREVGYKFGAWIDVGYWQLVL
jgi:phosphinothricin acetyltransferase